MDEPIPPLEITSRLKGTWLTKKPNPDGSLMAFWVSLFVFCIGFLSWGNFSFGTYLPATRTLVFSEHQYWRAWSTLFVHADIAHLLSNLLLFYLFGSFLAGYFGTLAFPILALFFGGLTNFFVLAQLPPQAQLIGISGVVYWMGGAWLVLYFFLERRYAFYKRVLRALGVGILLFIPAEAFDPSISYLAHGIGFFFGAIWGTIYFHWNRRKLRAAEEWIYEYSELPASV